MRSKLIGLMVLACSGLVFAAATTAPSVESPAKPEVDAKAEVKAPKGPIAPPTTFPTPAELIRKMRAEKKAKDSLPHVAYFDLSKPIVEKPADFSFFGDPDAPTLRGLLDRVRKAQDDKEIRGVLVTLGADNSISLAQAQELRDTLAAVTKAGKQTFVYADSYDTASYIAASGASHVCMLEGGEIMMPGVGLEAMFAKGLLDKVGVKADYIQIGEYKGADEQYTRTDASEQLKGEMNKLAEAMYEQIVDSISLARNISKEQVRGIIDEAMINGTAAKQRGLVDHLIDQDGLRDLMSDEFVADGKDDKVEIVHNYGAAEREEVDLSNPFAFFASMSKRPEPSGNPEVALIYLDGVITDGEGGEGMFGGNSAGSDDLRKALRQAARDENVKAVVIRIDSPGGSALASEVIWQAARRVAEDKPLVISIGGMAASGGYYVASAGDYIFADPSAIVGSIGVVGGKFVTKDLFDKLGLATESFSKGRNANLFSSNTPFDERQRKLITNWMKQTYEQFTSRIEETRGDKIKHIDDVARGRIFAAKQGKDLGLIDEIGGLHEALTFAASEAELDADGYDVRVLPTPKTFADLFTGNFDDASSPIRPQIRIDAGSVMDLFDAGTQRVFKQQVQSLQLLQRHPVLLVSPYIVNVR